jgi:xanthine/CO dehydrogenase XdhC/CoxF family maturation factor
MRILITIVAALGLAACGGEEKASEAPRTRASTIVEPETRVDTVPQEEPAVARSQWRASSDVARSVAGNLRVSLEGQRGGPVVFAFANGVTIRAQPYDVKPADTRSGVGGQSFAAVLGGDPRVDVYLYRVLDENVTRSAAQGGLCGRERTRNLAVSEFVDGSGRWVLKVAAFRGEASPPSNDDPQACNAYAYTAQ